MSCYCDPCDSGGRQAWKEDFTIFTTNTCPDECECDACCCCCCCEEDMGDSECDCCCGGGGGGGGKCKVKGRFGLAWVADTPYGQNQTPCGWQIEIVDTPSRVEQTCRDMMKWANTPPIQTCCDPPVQANVPCCCCCCCSCPPANPPKLHKKKCCCQPPADECCCCKPPKKDKCCCQQTAAKTCCCSQPKTSKKKCCCCPQQNSNSNNKQQCCCSKNKKRSPTRESSCCRKERRCPCEDDDDDSNADDSDYVDDGDGAESPYCDEQDDMEQWPNARCRGGGSCRDRRRSPVRSSFRTQSSRQEDPAREGSLRSGGKEGSDRVPPPMPCSNPPYGGDPAEEQSSITRQGSPTRSQSSRQSSTNRNLREEDKPRCSSYRNTSDIRENSSILAGREGSDRVSASMPCRNPSCRANPPKEQSSVSRQGSSPARSQSTRQSSTSSPNVRGEDVPRYSSYKNAPDSRDGSYLGGPSGQRCPDPSCRARQPERVTSDHDLSVLPAQPSGQSSSMHKAPSSRDGTMQRLGSARDQSAMQRQVSERESPMQRQASAKGSPMQRQASAKGSLAQKEQSPYRETSPYRQPSIQKETSGKVPSVERAGSSRNTSGRGVSPSQDYTPMSVNDTQQQKSQGKAKKGTIFSRLRGK